MNRLLILKTEIMPVSFLIANLLIILVVSGCGDINANHTEQITSELTTTTLTKKTETVQTETIVESKALSEELPIQQESIETKLQMPTEQSNQTQTLPTTASTMTNISPIFLECEEIALLVDDFVINLSYYGDISDLDSIFGKRIKEKINITDEFPHEGRKFIFIEYQDTSINLYAEGEGSNSFKLFDLETMSNKVQTIRGLKIGDNKQKLIQLYPELSKYENVNVEYIRIFGDGDLFNMTFYVKNDIVYKINIYLDLA